MLDDRTYYRKRAVREREAALRQAHPAARQAHLTLARQYDRLLAGLGLAG